jgi:hypothetical protein
MKDVVLSTGQTATIRSKDELTEGQSRKIEIARSRSVAVMQKYQKPVYLKPDPDSTEDNPKPDIQTFEVTNVRAMTATEPMMGIPNRELDQLSDEDWGFIDGFSDVLISEMTTAFEGSPLPDPTTLPKPVYDALETLVASEYAGLRQSTDSVDEKINPLATAAESTDSSSVPLT